MREGSRVSFEEREREEGNAKEARVYEGCECCFVERERKRGKVEAVGADDLGDFLRIGACDAPREGKLREGREEA